MIYVLEIFSTNYLNTFLVLCTMSQTNLENPLQLRCGSILPNKFAMAPLTNTQSNLDGTLSEDEYNWLTARAGQFGLLSTCATFVSKEGQAWKGQLGISEPEHLPGLTKLASAITSAGSLVIVQLHHAGDKADCAPQKISASASEGVNEATKEDIERIKKDFVKAALMAEQAGFSGVEIHGANGYIFTQFLSPVLNKRSDEYGGSIENRARFLRETLQAVRKVVSKTFIVFVRISPVDTFNRLGLILEDSKKVAQWLAEDGADVIHLSLRNARGPSPFEESTIPVVTAIREAVPKEVKVAVAGGVWTRADAEETEAAGADIIVLGRASIIHHNWVEVSKRPDFKPHLPPWDVESLKKEKVGSNFVDYLTYRHKLVKLQ